jgi:hypothetical protein
VSWSAHDVIILVVSCCWLANCIAFLVFRRGLPGTFGTPVASRTKAWAGIFLAFALIGIAVSGVATADESHASTGIWSPAAWVWGIGALFFFALAFYCQAIWVTVRTYRGNRAEGPDGIPQTGRHAARRQRRHSR